MKTVFLLRIKYILVSMLLIVVTQLAVGQTVERGCVLEYKGNAQKTPLSGVELNVKGASTVTSDAKGFFILKFPTQKPGQSIQCNEIYKSGFIIFNKDAVEAWRISNSQRTFRIIMCKENDFRALKKKYYGIFEKSYKKDYERQKQKAYAERKNVIELQTKLQQIEKDYEEKLSNINTYVETFARIDVSEMSSIEKEALQLVEDGHIEDGIKKFEELRLGQQTKQQLDKLQAGVIVVKAGQEIVNTAQQDLLALVEKIKTQIGLYNMGGYEFESKRDSSIAEIVNVYEALHKNFGSIYNNEFGYWLVALAKTNGYNTKDGLKYIQRAADLPSAQGLAMLGYINEVKSLDNTDSLYSKALECYRRAAKLSDASDSINIGQKALDHCPDFFITLGKNTLYFRIFSRMENTVSVCCKSIMRTNDCEGELIIPEKVSYKGKEYNVGCIDAEAFQNNRLLTSITIPSSVKLIGRDAFRGCNSLEDIYFQGDVNEIFEDETRNLKTTIPENTKLHFPPKIDNMLGWVIDRVTSMQKELADLAYTKAFSVKERDEIHSAYCSLVKQLSENTSLDEQSKLYCLETLANEYSDSCYKSTFNIERATQLYKGLIVKNSSNSGCYYERLGYLKRLKKQYEEAVWLYRKSIDCGWKNALNSLAYSYAQGLGVEKNFEQAHRLIDELIKADSTNINAYDSKGEFYLMEGDTIHAKEWLEKTTNKILTSQQNTGDFNTAMERYKKTSVLYKAFLPKENANNNNSINVQKLVDLAQAVSKTEYARIAYKNAIKAPQYEELLSIAIIAVQVILKNKTIEQLKKFSGTYITTALTWAIRNELQIRYSWYKYMYYNKHDDYALSQTDAVKLAIIKTTYNICKTAKASGDNFPVYSLFIGLYNIFDTIRSDEEYNEIQTLLLENKTNLKHNYSKEQLNEKVKNYADMVYKEITQKDNFKLLISSEYGK